MDPAHERVAVLHELVRRNKQARRVLTVDDLPVSLYNKLLHHFGSVADARQLAGLEAPLPRTKWTRERVIDEVRKLHRAGIWIKSHDLKLCGRSDLVGVIEHRFGGMPRVRRAAGVPDPPRPIVYPEPWDEDRVISEIRERARLRQPLAYTRAPRKLTSAGRRYFGNWRNAIEVAGFDYDEIRLVREPYEEAEVVAQLRALARRYPNMTASELHAHSIVQAIAHRCWSLEAMLKRAEIQGWPIRLTNGVMTTREVCRALRARHASGKPMTLRAIQSEDLRLVLAIRRHYRGIEGALVAAGLAEKVERQTRWTRREVLRQLRERRDRGLSLEASVVNRERQILYVKTRQLFGSYYAAAKRFGARRKTQTWTRERVLDELRKLGKRMGAINSGDASLALIKACKRYFGNFGNARRAAGIGSSGSSPPWSRSTLIEAIRDRVGDGAKLHKSLQLAARRHFGSVDAALFAAGVVRDPSASTGLRIVGPPYW